MNLDITETLAAYETVADKMEYLTKEVHEHVLKSGYLNINRKKIAKALSSIADRNDELLVSKYIGKLRHKIPPLQMGIKLGDHEKKRAVKIAAALITQVLIDSAAYPVDKRVESSMSKGQKKFHNRLYLQLGGSYEKDLLRGIEKEPGVANQKEVNGLKLNAVEKAWLRKVSSIPFAVSEVCTKELLMKGYSLKVDWNKKVDKNGRDLPEDPIVRKKRLEFYADTILEQVKPMECFYLPMKYCGRDRMYYEAAVLEGMRPHGKLWETLMIDAAKPFELTEDDERVLKHIIYVTLHGRVSVDEAVARFTAEDWLEAEMIDPMDQAEEDDFGEAIMLNKAAQALYDYKNGVKSRFMFGYDFTNSGLLMAGVSFRSEKMMAAGNIYGFADVVDSHSAFGAAYDLDLSRKDIKSIHMGLMHGSAMQSIAKTISETLGRKVTLDEVLEYNEKAYGKAVINIPKIAEWGTKIVGNEQTTLRWTMPDGFSAASRAYFKGVPVRVYVASASHKEGYTSYIIVSDMPWIEDSKGFPIYGKEVEIGGAVYPVEQKKRGLFASLTHGIDAYMLRCVGNQVIDSGRPILFKHDDYIAPPSAVNIVKAASKEVFHELYRDNLYQEAINEIAANSPYELEPLELIVDEGADRIEESDNFLMPG